MNVTVNSKQTDIEKNLTIEALFIKKNISPKNSIITINDNFIDKNDFSTIIKENDNIEIMSFVGGG